MERLTVGVALFLLVFATDVSAAMPISGTKDVVRLIGTERLPGADGKAIIQSAPDKSISIDLRLNDLKPATLFGGDFSTYVFWGISAVGTTTNLGEIRLENDSFEATFSTSSTFPALIVTAEPHFLVAAPSRFVVMRSAEDGTEFCCRYGGLYNYERSSLKGLREARGIVQTGVKQALTAFQLAQRAGAPEYASEELKAAERVLDEAIMLSRTHGEPDVTERRAREAVRLSVEAERVARQRSAAQASGQ